MMSVARNRITTGVKSPGKQLRRFVYGTVLIVCLTSVLFSTQGRKRKIVGKGFRRNIIQDISNLPRQVVQNATDPDTLQANNELSKCNNSCIYEEEDFKHASGENNTKNSENGKTKVQFPPVHSPELSSDKEHPSNDLNNTLPNMNVSNNGDGNIKAKILLDQSPDVVSDKENQFKDLTSNNQNANSSKSDSGSSNKLPSPTLSTKVNIEITQPLINSTPISGSQSTSDSTDFPRPTELLCDEPAYHEFPDDLFSNKQRAQGFVIIHILVGIYMFYALAAVCDEYFVASMEKICQKMGLSEDVAGATFMAAGSSAPELFASLLGVFVAKGDVGTGTIVGSAVFNILFVIGFCGLFAGQMVLLSWWPLLRDSFYYSITVIALIAVLADSVVTWWESFIMLLLYLIYIVIMKYNTKIHTWLMDNTRLSQMNEITQSAQGILSHDEKQIRTDYVQFSNEMEENYTGVSLYNQGCKVDANVDEIIRDFPRKYTFYEAALKVMSSRYFRPTTRFRCAGKRLIIEKRYLRQEDFSTKRVIINKGNGATGIPTNSSWYSPKALDEDWKQTPVVAEHGIVKVVKWFITVPVLATLHYTIPDCRTSRWDRWYLFTFFMAMLWIAFFSYILVWMVTLVGYTCGVPDTVMGITFLAAGTSIPDAYSSLLVAKQGFGDMAVSNSIGSNIFDILVGLALPWFLQTAVVNPNSKVSVSSGGLVFNVLLLFLTIAATIAAVHHCRWQLSKKLGVMLLLTYVVFLVFSLLIEFNVFGKVNLPECDQ